MNERTADGTAAHPARELGSFAVAGLTFTVHQHTTGPVAVYVRQTGAAVAHRVGLIRGISAGVARAEFDTVRDGATTLFHPDSPLADLVFAKALEIGARS